MKTNPSAVEQLAQIKLAKHNYWKSFRSEALMALLCMAAVMAGLAIVFGAVAGLSNLADWFTEINGLRSRVNALEHPEVIRQYGEYGMQIYGTNTFIPQTNVILTYPIFTNSGGYYVTNTFLLNNHS